MDGDKAIGHFHPRLWDALDYVRAKSLRTEVTTSGALLTEEWADALIDAGLGLLTLSLRMVDGTDMPAGGSRPRVWDDIRDVVQLVGNLIHTTSFFTACSGDEGKGILTGQNLASAS